MSRRTLGAVALLVALGATSAPLAAQVAVFPTLDPSRWVRVEAGHPDLEEPEPSAQSSAWFLTFTTPVPGDVVLVMELPVAYVSQAGQSTMAIGNPYVGARMQFYYTLLSEFEIGLRLPIAPEANEAMDFGLWADLTDRAEAFMYRSLVLNLRAVRTFDVGWHLGLPFDLEVDAAAGSIWWLMEGQAHTEQNAFLTYAGQVRSRFGPVLLGVGASGRQSVLGKATPQLADRTQQWSASLDVELFGVRPGAFVVVPTSEPATEFMGTTAGIRLLVPLGTQRLVR